MDAIDPPVRWRRFLRFRLWHFLLATAVVAAAVAWFGPRYVQQWEMRERGERYYQERLAVGKLKPAVEQGVRQLGGDVSWYPAAVPQGGMSVPGRVGSFNVFATRAAVQFHYHSKRPAPGVGLWATHLPKLAAYPELESLSFLDAPLDGAAFQGLPGSESLEAIVVMNHSLPVEGYEWCGRCANLRYFNFRVRSGRDFSNIPDDACVRELSNCPLLETVYLDGIDLSQDGVASIGRMQKLEVLHLATTEPLKLQAIDSLAKLPLKRLSIGGTRIAEELSAPLAQSKTLEELVLADIDDANLELLKRQLPQATVRRPGPFGFPSERQFDRQFWKQAE